MTWIERQKVIVLNSHGLGPCLYSPWQNVSRQDSCTLPLNLGTPTETFKNGIRRPAVLSLCGPARHDRKHEGIEHLSGQRGRLDFSHSHPSLTLEEPSNQRVSITKVASPRDRGFFTGFVCIVTLQFLALETPSLLQPRLDTSVGGLSSLMTQF